MFVNDWYSDVYKLINISSLCIFIQVKNETEIKSIE